MVVIVPHPTEELKLIKFAKFLISQNSTPATVFYRSIPLWIPLENHLNLSESELKKMAGTIKSITILKPEFSNQEIFCPVEIQLDDKKFRTSLTLAKQLYKSDSAIVDLECCDSQKLFPLSLKIFRLANSIDLSTNSKALNASVWKKI